MCITWSVFKVIDGANLDFSNIKREGILDTAIQGRLYEGGSAL